MKPKDNPKFQEPTRRKHKVQPIVADGRGLKLPVVIGDDVVLPAEEPQR